MSKTPTASSEAKEHEGTYKKLKKDAKDGSLDTTELEFGKEINQDHLNEVKKILEQLEKSVLKEDVLPELDTSLRIMLGSVTQAINNWYSLFKAGQLEEEEKISIKDKLSQIQIIIQN